MLSCATGRSPVGMTRPRSRRAAGAAGVGRSRLNAPRARRFAGATSGLLLVAAALLAAPVLHAQGTLLYFWAEGCSACDRAKPFLRRLEATHPALRIERLEISENPANMDTLRDAVRRYGVAKPFLPLFFYGDRFWVGYSEQQAREIEAAVAQPPGAPPPAAAEPARIKVPLLGSVEADTLSAWAATALIALVDGFNPCSLWVITFLLAVIVHTGSRGRVFAVGVTFLAVSASLYGAVVLGLFKAALLARFVGPIRAAIALLALVFAAINIKDYFWFKRGLSLTISEGGRSAIAESVRRIMRRRASVPAMLAATAVMAAGVTLMELPCTAGLPVLWTQIMARGGIDGALFVALLVLYLLVFLADEIGVLALAVVTLRQARLQERGGRLLKLLGGTVMASLAVGLLVDPEQAGDFLGVLAAFGAALAAAILIHSLTALAARTRKSRLPPDRGSPSS